MKDPTSGKMSLDDHNLFEAVGGDPHSMHWLGYDPRNEGEPQREKARWATQAGALALLRKKTQNNRHLLGIRMEILNLINLKLILYIREEAWRLLARGSACVTCAPGRITSSDASSSCAACEAGKSSSAGTNACFGE